MVTNELPAILTLSETARFLRVSKAHASKLANGKIHGLKPLPFVRLGRRLLIRREALLDWLLAAQYE